MTNAPGTSDSGVAPGSGPTAGPPRWVIVFGIVAVVVALLVVVLLITGGAGGHGPSRHGGMSGNQPTAGASLRG